MGALRELYLTCYGQIGELCGACYAQIHEVPPKTNKEIKSHM